MNWIDYVFIFILILNLYNGYKSGFIRQIAALLSFFVALYLALTWSRDLSRPLQEFLQIDRLIIPFFTDGAASAWLVEVIFNIVVFVLLFLIILLILKIVVGRLKVLNKVPVIGSINVILGTVFGILKGLFTIFLILSILSLIKIPFWDETVEVSVIATLSQHYMTILYDIIYEHVIENLGSLL